VAVNSSQISDLVNKLWARTKGGSITWEQFTNQNGFQARFGDFVIVISKPFSYNPGGITPVIANDVDLLVKRLDGKTIFTTQAPSNALGGLLNTLTMGTTVPNETKTVLRQMFAYLSSRDTDLDELLKIL